MMDMRRFTAVGPTYQDVKDKLFDQYVKPHYDDATGLDRESLVAGFETLAAQDGRMSRMELRSRLFALAALCVCAGECPHRCGSGGLVCRSL